jgi:hypothetical protein
MAHRAQAMDMVRIVESVRVVRAARLVPARTTGDQRGGPGFRSRSRRSSIGSMFSLT